MSAGGNPMSAGGNGFANGKDLFRLCAFLSGENPPDGWVVGKGTEAFENEPVDIVDGTPTPCTPRYYPPAGNGRKLWFYAFAPGVDADSYHSGNGTTTPKVTYDISREREVSGQKWTGQEDIMTATVADNGIGGGERDGEGNQRQPSFRFHHLLKRVTFKLVQDEGFASGLRASIIRIVDCRTRAVLDVVTGKLTFEGEPTGHVQVIGTWAINPPEDAVELPNVQLLCEPGPDLTVEVLSAGNIYRATLTLESDDSAIEPGGAGVSYLVTLKFKGTRVDANATVTPWTDVVDVSGDIR